MPPLPLSGPDGAIKVFEDWFAAAPPKQDEAHWRPESSAMELARTWCRDGAPAPPREMVDLLDTHPVTAGFRGTEGIVEQVTRLDDAGGVVHEFVADPQTPKQRTGLPKAHADLVAFVRLLTCLDLPDNALVGPPA